MTLDDLRRLSLRDVGNWPLLPKILALAFIFLVILAAGALFDWKDQYDALEARRSRTKASCASSTPTRRPRRSTTTSIASSCARSSSRSARC